MLRSGSPWPGGLALHMNNWRGTVQIAMFLGAGLMCLKWGARDLALLLFGIAGGSLVPSRPPGQVYQIGAPLPGGAPSVEIHDVTLANTKVR